LGFKAFRIAKGTQTYFEAFRSSKDPSIFVVLFDDIAGLLGLMIATLGIIASQLLDMPRLDGVASIGISLVLVISSLLLARETKELLIDEAASPHVRESILRIAGNDPDISGVNGVVTVQMGPRQIIAAMSAEFRDELSTTQIEHCVSRIETAIKLAHLDVTTLFVKPQTADTWRRRLAGLAARDHDTVETHE
jgi:divalent metal cation (Fe/Co/Zn/Cd) transporter